MPLGHEMEAESRELYSGVLEEMYADAPYNVPGPGGVPEWGGASLPTCPGWVGMVGGVGLGGDSKGKGGKGEVGLVQSQCPRAPHVPSAVSVASSSGSRLVSEAVST